MKFENYMQVEFPMARILVTVTTLEQLLRKQVVAVMLLLVRQVFPITELLQIAIMWEVLPVQTSVMEFLLKHAPTVIILTAQETAPSARPL